jgi:hypothetical protein
MPNHDIQVNFDDSTWSLVVNGEKIYSFGYEICARNAADRLRRALSWDNARNLELRRTYQRNRYREAHNIPIDAPRYCHSSHTFDIGKALALRENGLSLREIAKVVGTSHQNLNQIFKRMDEKCQRKP